MSYNFITWSIAALLAVASFLFWRKIGIRDIPNQRSAHVTDTPTAAGICIGLIFLIFSLLAENRIIKFEASLSSLLPSMLILLIVGFIDDWRELNYKVRLLSHALSVSLALVGQNLDMSDYCVWFFVGIGLINACNFLDGLNGLLVSQWLLTVGFLLFAFASFNSIFWILWFVTLIYLFFNFPKARIFIGDTGSTILGFFYFSIVFSLKASHHTIPSFIFPNDGFLIFCLFPMSIAWADVLFTIIRRLIEKRSIINSFGDYGFHLQAKFFKSHAIVTLAYLGLNLLLTWLVTLAFLNHHYTYCICLSYIVIQILHWFFIYKTIK